MSEQDMPVVLCLEAGGAQVLDPALVAEAGLILQAHAAPPAEGEFATVYVATDAWLEALRGGASRTGVALRPGAPVDLPMPVVTIPEGADARATVELLRAAAHLARSRASAVRLEERASTAEERIRALNEIGIALSAERDLDALLERILTEARQFTRSEAGSLYLLEEDGERMRFVQAQCEPVAFEFREATIPVGGGSIAGHVAMTGQDVVIADAYELPDGSPFAFNPAFDQATGFRTRAMVVVPMRDHEGQLVGVLQLMNPLDAAGEPTTYSPDLVPLLSSLATQAAVSVRATQLTRALQELFDNFASAAVTAIELRDPTTAGHSHRVADYSVILAEAVDRLGGGRFSSVDFTREEMTELRYAALLHDFGKIGVPERVLVKAKKLEDYQLDIIRERLNYVRDAGNDAAVRMLQARMREGRAPTAEDLEEIERLQAQRMAEFQQTWEQLVAANEPTVLAEEAGTTLRVLTEQTFQHPDRGEIPLLTTEEFELLSIPRGSLSETERRQIESHVTHTVTFLSTIPWTQGLRRIPEIAGAHHEKLNGAGYPSGLDEPRIPIQSRILSVSDIFDALTASDRPYKKAVPRDKSLAILEDEASRGVLDADLVEVFVGLAKEGRV